MQEHAEGLADGRAEGRVEEWMVNAHSLKEHDEPVDLIAKSLGLNPDEIEAL